KWWFRKSHLFFFCAFIIVYAIHSYSVWPIVVGLFWYVSMAYTYISVDRIRIFFLDSKRQRPFLPTDANGVEYVMRMDVTTSTIIPNLFGLYVFVVVDWITGSYTMIPMPNKMREC